MFFNMLHTCNDCSDTEPLHVMVKHIYEPCHRHFACEQNEIGPAVKRFQHAAAAPCM